MGVLITRSSIVSEQSLADGSSIVVTGPSVALPSYEWMGGLDGHQDAATAETTFSKSGWAALFSQFPWKYSAANVRNRANVIRSDNTYLTNDGRRTYFFDAGVAGVGQMYFSCNYWIEPDSSLTQFQHKFMRLMPVQDTNDGIDPSWYLSHWFANTYFVYVFNQHTFDTDGDYDFASPFFEFGAWVRVEVWMTNNSPDGTANGTWRIKTTRLSDGATIFEQTLSSIMFRGPTGAPVDLHRYLCIQNYNGNYSPAFAQITTDMDDMYFSWSDTTSGAWVRAELVNNATYASATSRDICEVTGISGTDWTVKLNGAGTGKYLALFNASDSPTMVEL